MVRTSGQVYEKVLLVASVPSTVATASNIRFSTSSNRNNAQRTGDMVHVDVASRHKLNIHHFPRASGVGIPSNLASSSLVKNVARTGLRRVGISVDSCEGGNEAVTKSLENIVREMCLRIDGIVGRLPCEKKIVSCFFISPGCLALTLS